MGFGVALRPMEMRRVKTFRVRVRVRVGVRVRVRPMEMRRVKTFRVRVRVRGGFEADGDEEGEDLMEMSRGKGEGWG